MYVSLVPTAPAQDNDIVFTVGMNSIKVFLENSPKGAGSQLDQTEGVYSFHYRDTDLLQFRSWFQLQYPRYFKVFYFYLTC